MQRFCKCKFSRHAATWLLTLLIALGGTLPAQAALGHAAIAPPVDASTDAANPTHAFTFDQIGAEVDKQSGQTSTVIATASGRFTPKAVSLGQDDFLPWKRGVSL